MRRREKFIIASVLLSTALLAVQYFSLEWRYLMIACLMLFSYLISAWALADDLQLHEWLTIVPAPALFSGSVALFYFLLPGNLISKIFIMLIFGVGVYALFLVSNIYSVAKGRTIQLLYAAHAVGLLIAVITSLLFTNSILSFRFPFWLNGLLVGLVHFPLVLMSLWSVSLENFVSKEVLAYSSLVTLVLLELTMLMSLLPMTVWYSALFIMGLFYIILGVMQSFLKGRLFQSTSTEYLLVTVFLGLVFLILLPWK